MVMKEILILGRDPTTDQLYRLYDELSYFLKNYAWKVTSPIDTYKEEGSGEDAYMGMLERVKESDLLLIELSKPLTFEGIAVREADLQEKPVLVVAGEKTIVPKGVRGCPAVKEVIFYRDFVELREKLSEFFEATS